MFLGYRFNSFDFFTGTIFSKSSAILLMTSLAAFSFLNFDMCKFILPTSLKWSKLGSLGLHRKILKLCILNMPSLSFSSSESYFSWFPSSISIMRLWFLNQISGYLLLIFLLSRMFSLGKSFCYWCFFSNYYVVAIIS